MLIKIVSTMKMPPNSTFPLKFFCAIRGTHMHLHFWSSSLRTVLESCCTSSPGTAKCDLFRNSEMKYMIITGPSYSTDNATDFHCWGRPEWQFRLKCNTSKPHRERSDIVACIKLYRMSQNRHTVDFKPCTVITEIIICMIG